MLGIKVEDIKHLVLVNYLLILVEAPVAFYFSYRYPDFSYSVSISIVSAIIMATFLVNLTLILKSSEIIRDVSLILFNVVEIICLTLIMHYVPAIRSVMILMYIPGIIFSSSMSLSYGVISMMTIIVCFLTLTIGENYHLSAFFSSVANVRDYGSVWQISNIFSFVFLMILAFMANYFFEILRRRKGRIENLADSNKLLYQKSKATSDEIFQTMSEALVVIDDKMNIIQNNKSFNELAGGKIEIIGKNILDLNIEFLSNLDEYIKEAKKSQTQSIYYKTTDQQKHNYSINVSTLELDKGNNGYIILITKHALPWGTVRDSKTNEPVDLVLVRLMTSENKRVLETKVTDREGRFGFMIPKGKYFLSVSKEGYQFPSKIIKDGYEGEEIEIKSDAEGVIKIDIPIDKI